jgi:hypothetical protein
VLISQLIILPLLVFEAWFYLELVRGRDPTRGVCAFDVGVIAASALACLALLPLVAVHESGANDRIWRPVLSTLTTFFAFPAVLLLGLVLRPARPRRADGDRAD